MMLLRWMSNQWRFLMLSVVRLLWTADRSGVTFCESCGQACTSACRSAAHLDRARTAALLRTLGH